MKITAIRAYQIELPLLAVQRSQCAAMHVEPGHPLREILCNDIDRNPVPLGEHVAQVLQPALGQQERPGPVSGVDGTTYDFCTLGNEETMVGLQMPAEWGIPEPDVVS